MVKTETIKKRKRTLAIMNERRKQETANKKKENQKSKQTDE